MTDPDFTAVRADIDSVDNRDDYNDHSERAVHWLGEASERNNPVAYWECIGAAMVHATLAQAAAIQRAGNLKILHH